jgi:ATP-dependent DNA helicase RecG
MTLEELQVLMNSTEDEHLEFKEAKGSYNLDKVGQYCSALANEGGGKLILGVTDSKPRKVVGTKAFQGTLDQTKGRLFDSLGRFRVSVGEVEHPDGRVVVFVSPPRPSGKLVEYQGYPWMRVGEGLTRMDSMTIKRALDEDETGPDFSARICAQAGLDDLDQDAIEIFREMWILKSGNASLRRISK